MYCLAVKVVGLSLGRFSLGVKVGVEVKGLRLGELKGLTCRRVDRKCDGHTDRQTDTHSKCIFCPCIALDKQ